MSLAKQGKKKVNKVTPFESLVKALFPKCSRCVLSSSVFDEIYLR